MSVRSRIYLGQHIAHYGGVLHSTSMTDIQGAKEYAVGWGTLALINAGLAQSKGRGGLIWFVISLFLGPLATLFIVVSSPKS